MAEWTDLKELRLRICDPSGVIGIETVADMDALPDDPSRQTAYRKEDTGTYVIYDEELETWDDADLELSDERLNALIDLVGVSAAAPRAIKLIMASIGKRMGIARSQGGAESITYQTLSDLYAYYKALSESMEEDAAVSAGVSTGRYLRTRRPVIGGGL